MHACALVFATPTILVVCHCLVNHVRSVEATSSAWVRINVMPLAKAAGNAGSSRYESWQPS